MPIKEGNLAIANYIVNTKTHDTVKITKNHEESARTIGQKLL